MKSKKFPSTLLAKIENALELELKDNNQPVAAFDADGTLWNTDLGETFFKYQIREKLIPNLPANPWKHYWDMKSSGDPRAAYLWLAQINQGFGLQKIRSWAQRNFEEQAPFPFFPEQVHLIEWLRNLGVKVFVVTASVKWAVEPGAQALGLSEDRVLGVETEVISGKIGNQQHGVITYKEGKAQAVSIATGGVKPFLAVGNSNGDFDLLQSSKGVALAVRSAKAGEELYSPEEALFSEAVHRGWLRHQFDR